MDGTARHITYATTARSRPGRAVIRGMEALSGRAGLLRRARGYDAAVAHGADFWEEMAARYGLAPEVRRGSLAAIPRSGPVMVVANHPYGILDGLILSLILARRRGPDGFKVVANDVFLRSPDLARVVLPVDFDDGPAARATNLAMRRDALAWMGAGGAIGIFPAGGVSTARRPWAPPRDAPWRGFTAKLVRRSGATIVPIHFHGANSRAFHLASHLHANLRAGLLLREFRARTDRPVPLSVGAPVPPERIAAFGGTQADLMRWLRRITYEAGGVDDRPGFDFDAQRMGCA